MKFEKHTNHHITWYTYGKGPAVVFLHGFCLPGDIWLPLLRNLGKQHKIIIIDLPGFGGSKPPENFDLEAIGASLWKLLDASGKQGVFLAGHSMGGYIAAEMAIQHPDRCSGLILVNSHFKGDSEDKKENRLKNVEFIQRNGTKDWLKKFYNSLFYNKLTSEKYVQNYIKIFSAIPSDTIIGYTLAMADRKDRRNQIAEIQVPVCIIAGREDPHISEEEVLQCAFISEVTFYHMLARCGHMSMLEYPGKTGGYIKHFLQYVKLA